MSSPQSEVEHDHLQSRRNTGNRNSVSSSFNYSQGVVEGQGEIEDDINGSEVQSSNSDEDFVVERREKKKKKSGLRQNKKPKGKKALKDLNFPNDSLPAPKESSVNKPPAPNTPEVHTSPTINYKKIDTPKKGQVLITRIGGQVKVTEHLESPQSIAFINGSAPQSVKRPVSCDAQLMDVEQGFESSQHNEIEVDKSSEEIRAKTINMDVDDESPSEVKLSKHLVIEPSNDNIKFELVFKGQGVDQIEDAAGFGSITIATPDRINLREDVDEEGFPAPSNLYAADEVKETPNIVKHLEDHSAVTENLSCTSSHININKMIHSPPSTVSIEDTVTTTTTPSYLSQSESFLTPMQMRARANKSGGRGRGTIGRGRQLGRGRGRIRAPGAPYVKPPNLVPRQLGPIRPRPSQSQPRMISHSQYRPTVSGLEPGQSVGKSRVPKQYSLSAPNPNNAEPLLVQLNFPNREDAVMCTPSSRGSSEGAGLSSIPNAMPDLILPPGISITRTPRSAVNLNTDHVPAAALSSLARALACLGDTQDGKRPVTFELTESQVEGLRTLGLYET